MTMPSGSQFWADELSKSVKNGSVPESRITDMATRIIASWYQMGQDQDFPEPGIGMPADLTKPHKIVDARNESSRSILFDGAVEGHVLLKNKNNALPLKSPRLLSIYGFSAKAPDHNNIAAGQGSWALGAESYGLEEILSGFAFGEVREHSAIAINGTIVSGGGSGATSQSRIISPLDAITQQAYEDDTALFWDLVSGTPQVNPASDACLVIVNAFASEGFDRPNLHDDYTDGLIKNVADQCNNTIVVFHNAGIRLVDQWIDHANVTALIFAHLPGQDSGKALVSILYGKSNPSGKLPYTVARNESDYGELQSPDLPEGIFAEFPQSNFTETVFVDYRHFDANNIEPRFEFGFGLSYTTFEYSNLAINTTSDDTAEFPSKGVAEGGPADLWDVIARVTADVANTGQVGGAEVAQLYVGVPGDGTPVRQLRGFEKPFVNASETASVAFELTRRDLSVWDVVAQAWRLQRGEYGVWVGGSSRDLKLEGKLTI
jgi:beta-glucosidase